MNDTYSPMTLSGMSPASCSRSWRAPCGPGQLTRRIREAASGTHVVLDQLLVLDLQLVIERDASLGAVDLSRGISEKSDSCQVIDSYLVGGAPSCDDLLKEEVGSHVLMRPGERTGRLLGQRLYPVCRSSSPCERERKG